MKKSSRYRSAVLRAVTLLPKVYILAAISPPQILPYPTSIQQVVRKGTAVHLPCRVQADPETVLFEWHKERQLLTTLASDRFKVFQNGSLRIKEATTEDTGVYICRAVNGFGSVETNATLVVVSDLDHKGSTEGEKLHHNNTFSVKPRVPHITKIERRVFQRPVGSSVHLKCGAIGQPLPEIKWMKDGFEIDLTPHIKKGRWSLHLQNLQVSDSGNYTCVAHNVFGSANISFLVEVVDRIRHKPEMTGTHPLNTTVQYGGMATLQCRVLSDDPPHIQWLKQIAEEDLNPDQKDIIQVQNEYFQVMKSSDILEIPGGSFLNKLYIPEAREKDSGKYICLSANTMGYSSRSAFLTVLPRLSTYSNGYNSYSQKTSSNTLVIVIPISLGLVVGIIVAMGVLCHHHRLGLSLSSRAGNETVCLNTNSQISQTMDLSHMDSTCFKHGILKSQSTWLSESSTVTMETEQSPFSSDCESSHFLHPERTTYHHLQCSVMKDKIMPEAYSPPAKAPRTRILY